MNCDYIVTSIEINSMMHQSRGKIDTLVQGDRVKVNYASLDGQGSIFKIADVVLTAEEMTAFNDLFRRVFNRIFSVDAGGLAE